MIKKEKEIAEDKRMEFVSIVTPNHVHFGPAMFLFLLFYFILFLDIYNGELIMK
jgi:hypothetical protein